jgi:hypothetical protein
VPTVLVDSFGNVVLAPAGSAAPILSAPADAASAGPSPSARDGSEPAQATTAKPSEGPQPAAAERRSDNGAAPGEPSRIVRVWVGR